MQTQFYIAKLWHTSTQLAVKRSRGLYKAIDITSICCSAAEHNSPLWGKMSLWKLTSTWLFMTLLALGDHRHCDYFDYDRFTMFICLEIKLFISLTQQILCSMFPWLDWRLGSKSERWCQTNPLKSIKVAMWGFRCSNVNLSPRPIICCNRSLWWCGLDSANWTRISLFCFSFYFFVVVVTGQSTMTMWCHL